eukprot:snap_masked-scaffold_1-processed-gene-5.11-mRNA-1 protein AED:1.00 eAED:1.00 QI:0/0/0/0/1/1/2/0/443
MAENRTCESPFAGRLDPKLQIYQSVYTCFYILFILVSVVLWKVRSWHPALRDKPIGVFIIQSICALFYAGFTSLFIFDQPSALTSCGSSVVFLILVHGMAAPSLAINIWLIFKSEYNQKLSEYFTEKSFLDRSSFMSLSIPVTGSKESVDTDRTRHNHLNRLKWLSSTKFLKLLLLVLLMSLLFSAIFLWAVICKGFITGKECNLDVTGFKALYIIGVLGTVILAILVNYVMKTHKNYMQIKYDKNYWDNAVYFLAIPTILGFFINALNMFTIDTYDRDVISFGPNLLLDAYYWFGMGLILKTFDGVKRSSVSKEDGISLDDILDNHGAKVIFQQFLIETYCSENLAFINHVAMFKKLKGRALVKRAKFLVRGFILPDSYGEINISSRSKTSIIEQYRNKQYTVNMFDDAEEEIIDVLVYDSLPKFKATENYVQMFAGGPNNI